MQKPLPEETWLNAAECAERTGLTVRALRVYERHGLIAPRRTTANWRLYGPTEIARLMEIIALKRLGLSLARIAGLLAGHTTDIGSVLDMQQSLLSERRSLADRALRSIGAMRDQLAGGATPSIDALLCLLKETEMTEKPRVPLPGGATSRCVRAARRDSIGASTKTMPVPICWSSASALWSRPGRDGCSCA